MKWTIVLTRMLPAICCTLLSVGCRTAWYQCYDGMRLPANRVAWIISSKDDGTFNLSSVDMRYVLTYPPLCRTKVIELDSREQKTHLGFDYEGLKKISVLAPVRPGRTYRISPTKGGNYKHLFSQKRTQKDPDVRTISERTRNCFLVDVTDQEGPPTEDLSRFEKSKPDPFTRSHREMNWLFR